MTTLLQQIPLPALEEIVEVLATRQALLFAKELRFEGLVMEGDSEIIINAIKGDNMNLSHYGQLVIYRMTLSFLALLLEIFLFTMLEDKGIV